MGFTEIRQERTTFGEAIVPLRLNPPKDVRADQYIAQRHLAIEDRRPHGIGSIAEIDPHKADFHHPCGSIQGQRNPPLINITVLTAGEDVQIDVLPKMLAQPKRHVLVVHKKLPIRLGKRRRRDRLIMIHRRAGSE